MTRLVASHSETVKRCLPLLVLVGLLAGALAAFGQSTGSAASHSSRTPLSDAGDREAARAWFVAIADAQFYAPSPRVQDCAGLIRHALGEALRPHTPEWRRLVALPQTVSLPELRMPLRVETSFLPLFRVTSAPPHRFVEFADAATIVHLNARPMGRATTRARPGDLLYFHQPSQQAPHHLMVFVGRSHFEPEGDDWVVYHTGPSDTPPGEGEVRKVRLTDLMRHPADRWRPLAVNPNFVGVFRLEML